MIGIVVLLKTVREGEDFSVNGTNAVSGISQYHADDRIPVNIPMAVAPRLDIASQTRILGCVLGLWFLLTRVPFLSKTKSSVMEELDGRLIVINHIFQCFLVQYQLLAPVKTLLHHVQVTFPQ